jgi:hypothetical protein
LPHDAISGSKIDNLQLLGQIIVPLLRTKNTSKMTIATLPMSLRQQVGSKAMVAISGKSLSNVTAPVHEEVHEEVHFKYLAS